MISGYSTIFFVYVEWFFKKFCDFVAYLKKSVITAVKGIDATAPERRNGAYGKREYAGAYWYPAGNQHCRKESGSEADAD